MEGSYDRVWGATKKEGVPSEEFAVFSEVNFPYVLLFFTHLVKTPSNTLRSSSAQSAPKSLPVRKKRTHPFLSQMPRIFFS